MIAPERAHALIRGGPGNSAVSDPGWPKGAAVLFNSASRVAWWEGPPFGGGEWHAEYRGDSKAFNTLLAEFAKVDVKVKRVIVHDGIAHSFWLNPNREPVKEEAARIDWSFTVWQPANWEALRGLRADLNPTDPRDAKLGPPARLDVYTGGDLRWADVTMPKGIEVIDQRLEAHGFTTADGVVLEGKVVDLPAQKPNAAHVRLERVGPRSTGVYRYPQAAETQADAQGHWILKKIPPGWYRIVVEADGFASRVAGHARFDDQPLWSSYDVGLSPVATVAGRVIDQEGFPIANAEVQIRDLSSDAAGRYESPDDVTFKTDAEGRFRSERLPIGRATVWVYKAGYCRPGLGLPITMPTKSVELRMMKSAQVRVTVDFQGRDRPQGYIVEIEPEGGAAIGKWSGSGNIDLKNQISFKDVPPGRYVLWGHPNPSAANERSIPLKVLLEGGESSEVTIAAK